MSAPKRELRTRDANGVPLRKVRQTSNPHRHTGIAWWVGKDRAAFTQAMQERRDVLTSDKVLGIGTSWEDWTHGKRSDAVESATQEPE